MVNRTQVNDLEMNIIEGWTRLIEAAGDVDDIKKDPPKPPPFNKPDDEDDKYSNQKRELLPILPLRNSVFFPGTIMPIIIGRPKTIRLLQSLEKGSGTMGIVSQKDKLTEDPTPEELYTIGASAKVIKYSQEEEDTYHIVVQGLERFKVLRYISQEPYIQAEVETIPEDPTNDLEVEVLIRNIKGVANEVIALIPEIPVSSAEILDRVREPWRMVNLIVTNLNIAIQEKIKILETYSIKERLKKTLTLLHHQLEMLRISNKINSEIKGEMNKTQREYYLRQQMKAIKKELGELDEDIDGLDELKEKLESMNLPPVVQKLVRKEFTRLKTIQPTSPEYTVARTYLDWIADLPWNTQTTDDLDIAHARKVLDDDHYDLEKIKKRILEYLAVRRLKTDMKGPILCFVGPPGVGKTSLGHSIASALGRKFIRVSFGGVRDEAEIRGHRRTYIGALPGKIIQQMKRAESRNPVFMMDEVDKLGKDWRGDPSNALLEVLDPEQNNTFMDHYLDIPFDLSRVLFIATANVTDTIPPALLDRMEVIEIPGYVREEKLAIARRHLMPRQLNEHGLSVEQAIITDNIVNYVIDHYTREAGVRNLERTIAGIYRAIAVGIVEGKYDKKEVDLNDLLEFLGPDKYQPEVRERTEIPGVSTGLAWTQYGGEILFIETTRMPGQGKLRLTGQLGDVMKESAEIALSYVKSKADFYGISDDVFKNSDIHIHIPQGAIPKDGPSAGVTMLSSVVSLLTKRTVKNDIAMTGEITLRGLVLPVGGIKDKVLAALRSGINRIILPEKNRKDLSEIPEKTRNELEFLFVNNINEVLDLALNPLPVEEVKVTLEGAPEGEKKAVDERAPDGVSPIGSA